MAVLNFVEPTVLTDAEFDAMETKFLETIMARDYLSDLNPNITDEEFNLFHKVVRAYQQSDINTLRRIDMLTDKISADSGNKYEAKKLRYNRLKSACE